MLVLSVCSLKGGVGKTSVVLGLASAALAAKVPTLVVDLDPQGDATTALDVTEPPASHVAMVLDRPSAEIVRSAVGPSSWTRDWPGSHLDVLVGSPDAARHDHPYPSATALGRLRSALGRTEGYDLVLIDCPPSLGGLTRTGLVASQRALVVTEPGLFALQAADRVLATIDIVRKDHAPDLQPLGIIANRVRSRTTEHAFRLEELASMFGPLFLNPFIPERAAVQQAQGALGPIHGWPSAGAREMAQRFDALLARALRAPAARVRGESRATR